MNMNLNLDNLLNLPRTTVISSEKASDFYLLQLRFTNQGISCPQRTRIFRDIASN